MGLRERYNLENELKLMFSSHVSKKARDIEEFVKIDKIYKVDKEAEVDKETGIPIPTYDYVVFTKDIYFYAPTSFKNLIDKEINETSLNELNEQLTTEPVEVKFNKIPLKNGQSWIETTIK